MIVEGVWGERLKEEEKKEGEGEGEGEGERQVERIEVVKELVRENNLWGLGVVVGKGEGVEGGGRFGREVERELLNFVIGEKNEGALGVLLRYFSEPKPHHHHHLHQEQQQQQWSPLQTAVWEGWVEGVKRLLNCGWGREINEREGDEDGEGEGWGVLHLCAGGVGGGRGGEILQILLKVEGVDVFLEDFRGRWAVEVAEEEGEGE